MSVWRRLIFRLLGVFVVDLPPDAVLVIHCDQPMEPMTHESIERLGRRLNRHVLVTGPHYRVAGVLKGVRP